MSNGFSIDFSEISGLRNDLRAWGESVKNEVAMAGVAAGAKVFYNTARSIVPISDAAHTFYGRASKRTGVTYHFAPGNLQRAIYRAYSPEKSTPTRKEYRISWNARKAPYGHMVEFGTSKAAPHSFIGAALSASGDALQAAKGAMKDQLIILRGRTS